MSNILRVRWTLKPSVAPRPWLHCSRCGCPRPFQSSGKVRLNANGKRLDAWLVYKCADCDSSWNRPLFERRPIGELDPDLLHALQNNAPDWVERWAFDVNDLNRNAQRIEESPEIHVHKRTIAESPPPWSSLEITVALAAPTACRTDRLLSSELRLSRTPVERLHENGSLVILPTVSRPLSKRVTDGMRIVVDISSAGGDDIAGAAVEPARTSAAAADGCPAPWRVA